MRPLTLRASHVLAVLVSIAATGCYHFRFQQQRATAVAPQQVVVHEVRVPTYVNGFVGTGEVDTTRYCDEPVHTELRVTATDVLLSVATLLIYTPHTLYVTCPVPTATAEASFEGSDD